jgi:phosphopantetheinyl transferase (holo-ACP synthase)
VEIGPETSNGYQIVLHDRLKAAAEQLGVRGIKLSVAHHGSQTSAVVMLED